MTMAGYVPINCAQVVIIIFLDKEILEKRPFSFHFARKSFYMNNKNVSYAKPHLKSSTELGKITLSKTFSFCSVEIDVTLHVFFVVEACNLMR